MSKQYEILFLPWTPFDWDSLGGELRVGHVLLQPLSAFQAEPKVASFLHRYFQRYRDMYDMPVETITLCHYHPEQRGYLQPTENREREAVEDAVNLLLFCAVWDYLRDTIGKGWSSVPPPNSEMFALMGQAFTEDVLQADQPMVTLLFHGLWQIESLEKLRFCMPLNAHTYANIHVKIQLNLPLLQALQKVFREDFDAQERRRVSRSLEWFRLAHRKDTPAEVQVVSIATALETLFPPESPNQTRQTLASAVDCWIRDRWGNSVIKTSRKNAKGKSIDRTEAGFWMWDFYDLRSKIVHGDLIADEELYLSLPPPPNDTRVRRIAKADVASFVYGALLLHKLAVEYRPEEPEYLADAPEDVREMFFALYRDFPWRMDNCLKRLGWIRETGAPHNPQSLRRFWRATLGDALQALSDESLIEERERNRPVPFKEEPNKS